MPELKANIMSDVVDSIEKSFADLVMSGKTYRSITVKEICEGAFVSRRTFYANFVDKRAVVAYILRRDAVYPVKRVIELLSADEVEAMYSDVIGRFYQGIFDNREFYSSLAKPMRHVDTTFSRVVVRAVSKLIEDGVTRYNRDVDKKLLAYTAAYHANAVALTIERWIYENYETPLKQMVEYQATILMPNLKSLL